MQRTGFTLLWFFFFFKTLKNVKTQRVHKIIAVFFCFEKIASLAIISDFLPKGIAFCAGRNQDMVLNFSRLLEQNK